MSIFRDTFQDQIKAELNKRQEAMLGSNRTPDVIQYLNSRNSWVRMTSSVNVGGLPDLAKSYVLMGGTLNNNFKLKSGVGEGNQAYSTKTPGGGNNRLGLRPMPGITNVEIKSKSAYGSLREAVVSFQCWDIKQLEDLELLYMRPGYTVLLEWGWFPYLDNSKKLVKDPPNFYDILNKGKTNRSEIFKTLYSNCTKSGGNYDAMFGYVKNYQWSARPDGGYDCQTTIISTGEIIESLKVNYTEPDLTRLNKADTDGVGFLNEEFENQGTFARNKWKEHYEKNKLAGIWAELYDKLDPYGPGNKVAATSILKDRNISFYFPILQSTNSNDSNTLIEGSSRQTYITLEAMFSILQKYIVPKDSIGEPLLKLNLDTENYAGEKQPLLCVAHPLQVSVDPTVCLIKSPIWYQTGGILTTVSGAVSSVGAQSIIDDLRNAVQNVSQTNIGQKIIDFTNIVRQRITNVSIYNAVEAASPSIIQNVVNFGGVLSNQELIKYDPLINHLKTILEPTYIITSITSTSLSGKVLLNQLFIRPNPASPPVAAPTIPTALQPTTISKSISQAITKISGLDKLKQPYFSGNSYGYDELGIIKNIYVNLDFLYKKALDLNIESTDSKEKAEISLYKYLKNIMAAIQPSIGNVNNFEIHVDPVDNEARIIDINYTGNEVANKLFELQVHNTKSVVRNYTLQSQIFPEQSSIIAIGSQAKGGQLGIQNNTMIDFNRTLTDRIIPDKLFADGRNLEDPQNNTTNVASNLAIIISLFGKLAERPQPQSQPSGESVAPPNGPDLNILYTRCKNNLRDLIVYFQSITASSGANRGIIPIKFSFEMDGIGGLVIGHLFRINDDILPRGYKIANLAQTVTGIGHSIKDGDWVTKIDALNIILDRKNLGIPFNKLDLKAIIESSFENILQPDATTSGGGVISSGACGSFYTDANLISGNWLGKEQQFTRTVVDPAKEGPILSKQYGKILAQAILATIKLEQNFSGFNWNLGGFDITSGGWKFDATYHNGYVVAREGGTNLCKAFISFIDFQSFVKYKVDSFKRKGFDKTTTADGFANAWYQRWNGYGARALRSDAENLKLARDAWNSVAQYL